MRDSYSLPVAARFDGQVLRGIATLQHISQRCEPEGSTGNVHHIGDAGRNEKLTCSTATPTALAHHVHGNRLAKSLDVVGHSAERNQRCARHMTFAVFVGLTNVDDGSTTLDDLGQFAGRYLSHMYGGRAYTSLERFSVMSCNVATSFTFVHSVVVQATREIRRSVNAWWMARCPARYCARTCSRMSTRAAKIDQ